MRRSEQGMKNKGAKKKFNLVRFLLIFLCAYSILIESYPEI
jgi:hypothetical protein